MKYSEILDKVQALAPHEYSDDEILGWMREVNSDVLRNIEKNPKPGGDIKPESVTIIPSPYDSMYIYYILAKIAYFQKDYDSYAVHNEQYERKRNEYLAYYIRTNGADSAVFKNWI